MGSVPGFSNVTDGLAERCIRTLVGKRGGGEYRVGYPPTYADFSATYCGKIYNFGSLFQHNSGAKFSLVAQRNPRGVFLLDGRLPVDFWWDDLCFRVPEALNESEGYVVMLLISLDLDTAYGPPRPSATLKAKVTSATECSPSEKCLTYPYRRRTVHHNISESENWPQ